jgi:hypothetical protein
MSLPPTSAPTSVISTYGVRPMNTTSMGPPMPTVALGRPLATVVTSPVWGSIRDSRPAAPSVTNRAPPGPIALPLPPSSPVASRVETGASDDGVARGVAAVVTARIASRSPKIFREIM